MGLEWVGFKGGEGRYPVFAASSVYIGHGTTSSGSNRRSRKFASGLRLTRRRGRSDDGVNPSKEKTVADEKQDVVGWCVIELMGHRRLTGYVRPVEIANAPFLRIDVPTPETKDENGPWQATQFYSPSAVYCITPTTADLAVKAAGINSPAPVTRWDLPSEPTPTQLPAPGRYSAQRGFSDDDRDDDPDF